MANTYGGISIAAVRVDDPEHKVMTFNAGSGGAWGRRGVALDSTGTAWTTTATASTTRPAIRRATPTALSASKSRTAS